MWLYPYWPSSKVVVRRNYTTKPNTNQTDGELIAYQGSHDWVTWYPCDFTAANGIGQFCRRKVKINYCLVDTNTSCQNDIITRNWSNGILRRCLRKQFSFNSKTCATIWVIESKPCFPWLCPILCSEMCLDIRPKMLFDFERCKMNCQRCIFKMKITPRWQEMHKWKILWRLNKILSGMKKEAFTKRADEK